jgi:hypothetical protein
MCNSNQISILDIQISRDLPEIISEVKIYYVSGEFQTEREYVLVLNKKIKKYNSMIEQKRIKRF